MAAIGQTIYHLGLTGYPLGHSLSPVMHQAALQSLGMQGEYVLYPVPPDRVSRELAGLVERLRQGELDGLNVTIPHKQAVLPLVDELTPAARAVGAANTLYRQAGRVIGHNTDIEGFLAGLDSVIERQPPRGPAASRRQALVLGAGGSARAVVYALAQAGWQVTIAARRVEQAQALAAELEESLAAADAGENAGADSIRPYEGGLDGLVLDGLGPVGLVVNTTPVGMFPAVGGSPWPEHLPFPAGTAVYDLVYNPPLTALVRSARAAGLAAETGLGMLVAQAALAFEIWTGRAPARQAMRQAAEARLSDLKNER